uniref:Uncharacterized protein n=1 Tax=Cacopsylla melanoneura TaxID=428564 RepID=A0A8D8YJ24_9HEMI
MLKRICKSNTNFTFMSIQIKSSSTPLCFKIIIYYFVVSSISSSYSSAIFLMLRRSILFTRDGLLLLLLLPLLIFLHFINFLLHIPHPPYSSSTITILFLSLALTPSGRYQ